MMMSKIESKKRENQCSKRNQKGFVKVTSFGRAKSHVGRKRLKCGHWAKLSRRNYCDKCYNNSPRGRERNKVYNATAKGKLRLIRLYFKKRSQGQTAHEAKLVVKILDPMETERRLKQYRLTNKKASQRFRARWGNLNVNPVHRHRWEMVRSGMWKEEEHPL